MGMMGAVRCRKQTSHFARLLVQPTHIGWCTAVARLIYNSRIQGNCRRTEPGGQKNSGGPSLPAALPLLASPADPCSCCPARRCCRSSCESEAAPWEAPAECTLLSAAAAAAAAPAAAVGSPALLFSLLSTLSSDTRALPDGDLQGVQAVQQRETSLAAAAPGIKCMIVVRRGSAEQHRQACMHTAGSPPAQPGLPRRRCPCPCPGLLQQEALLGRG